MGSFFKNDKVYTGRVEAELTGSNVQQLISEQTINIGAGLSYFTDRLNVDQYRYLSATAYVLDGFTTPPSIDVYENSDSTNGSDANITPTQQDSGKVVYSPKVERKLGNQSMLKVTNNDGVALDMEIKRYGWL